MSGHSDSEKCVRCETENSLMTYSDYKPHDSINGECLECGFEYYTECGTQTLEEVNERRKDHELKPIATLKKQAFNCEE